MHMVLGHLQAALSMHRGIPRPAAPHCSMAALPSHLCSMHMVWGHLQAALSMHRYRGMPRPAGSMHRAQLQQQSIDCMLQHAMAASVHHAHGGEAPGTCMAQLSYFTQGHGIHWPCACACASLCMCLTFMWIPMMCVGWRHCPASVLAAC